MAPVAVKRITHALEGIKRDADGKNYFRHRDREGRQGHMEQTDGVIQHSYQKCGILEIGKQADIHGYGNKENPTPLTIR